ncbi:MAG TPA: YlxR family RNase P modulator [Pseudonocardia sp.]|uniref:YlxR family protein n=1 Tax=Pseudonocardia sp. TaxID=60912 RepID=UPI002F429AF1
MIRSGEPGRATLLVASSHDSATTRTFVGGPSLTASPVRTCVGCRSRSAATGLLRVVAVAGVLTPDPKRRLPGRGAWLHFDPECLRRAHRRGAFPRALRVPGPLAVDELRRYLQPTPKCETVSHLDHESQVDPS